MPKNLQVNVSSLVDLKAELFRKQEEKRKADALKTSNIQTQNGAVPSTSTRNNVFKQHRQSQKESESKVLERRERLKRLEVEIKEEERQMRKAKETLERKARLYDKLAAGTVADDNGAESESTYLVNFGQKLRDDEYDREEQQEHCGGGVSSMSTTERPSSPCDDGSFVEYTDSFGRTRKCLKEDLETMKDRDVIHTQLSSSVVVGGSGVDFSSSSEMMSEDMRRELQRKQWEREEQEAFASSSSSADGPLHYQQAANNEARELGVGYFAFSADEETRTEQRERLDELRQQTVEQRARSDQIKRKRQQMIAERLAKVRKRKHLVADDGQMGDLFDDDERPTVTDPSELESIPLPTEETNLSERKPSAATGATQKQPTQVRPWDVGKSKLLPPEKWVEQQREKRTDEFAPPSRY